MTIHLIFLWVALWLAEIQSKQDISECLSIYSLPSRCVCVWTWHNLNSAVFARVLSANQHINAHMYTHSHTFVCICMRHYVYVCNFVCVYVCMCVCVYVCLCVLYPCLVCFCLNAIICHLICVCHALGCTHRGTHTYLCMRTLIKLYLWFSELI